MSGGGANRKKPQRGQCWEEAGAEFYQESYPSTDAEFEVLQKDPKHLATLLPSKQNRAATIRLRTTDTRTFRRQTSSRSRRESTTIRRPSMAADVQVSMLPDLSENLSNEQKTWEEIMEIKAMPVPMAQKKQLKEKIQNEPNLRLQGYEQFKWKRRKVLKQIKERVEELFSKLELWRTALKKIEGNFGTGVVAYFLFIKWLMFLNLVIFLFILVFIIIPTTLTQENLSECDCQELNSTSCCACDYFNQTSQFNINIPLELVQGTGFFEHTLLFYGYYPNKIMEFDINGSTFYYNLPLAYICVTLICFMLSLVKIINSAAKGFKDRLIEGEGQFYQYCNIVFGGWDFCIHNEKSAAIKHKALHNEIAASLKSERLEEERQSRTRNEKMKLFLLRVFINIIVVSVLAGAATSVYFAFIFSTKELKSHVQLTDITNSDNIVRLLYEFLPSLTIVLLNIIVPFVFTFLVKFEKYNALFVIRLTLFRTILLRMFSLIVLYYTLYVKIKCEDIDENDCSCKNGPICWETYVGQQYYKLLLTDFATNVFLTFFINFPRAIVGKSCESKCAKMLCQQSFDLPKHVLDIIYFQTLCWIGCFYSPFLPAIATITCFLMFYIKKFTCLINCVPSYTVYRASRSNSMFMFVLLISYVFAAIPLVYSIGELTPSKSCGPFRNLPIIWSVLQNTFYSTPSLIQSVVYFISTPGFALPVLVVLILTLYYYSAVIDANRHMVIVLKNQLVLEGHDKQFLLDRLSTFIKQQQEMQKRLRHAEIMREGDRN